MPKKLNNKTFYIKSILLGVVCLLLSLVLNKLREYEAIYLYENRCLILDRVQQVLCLIALAVIVADAFIFLKFNRDNINIAKIYDRLHKNTKIEDIRQGMSLRQVRILVERDKRYTQLGSYGELMSSELIGNKVLEDTYFWHLTDSATNRENCKLHVSFRNDRVFAIEILRG